MNDYQFWDELGKIFNAVMAYQEKAVEFNKRFINPWIPLGNVFDGRERNTDAIRAFHKAIELDPANSQNWYELANVHFRMKSYEEAAEAYRRAIELRPEFGSAHSNLALTLASQGRLAEAIPLYQKSIELLEDDKEKAVAWNRLGNLHRKLNEYALAVEAFQKADELDSENAGFRDELDEQPVAGPPPEELGPAAESTTAVASLDPLQLIVAEGGAQDARAATAELTASNTAPEATPDALDGQTPVHVDATPPTAAPSEAAPAAEDFAAAMLANPALPSGAPVYEASGAFGLADGVFGAAFVETLSAPDDDSETDTTLSVAEAPADLPLEAEPAEPEVPSSVEVQNHVAPADVPPAKVMPVEPAPAAPGPNEAAADAAEGLLEERFTRHVAYEEYLRDSDPTIDLPSEPEAEPELPSQDQAGRVPTTKVDPSGELQIEMDAKNAHVWNELGNIYFNNGEFDDAVIAYSKSIELDRWFAWPYSNLALTYVQKNRFSEAILLYQRSIELFKDQKDQAISWNRLGNVYRRINDYERAIAAYQRADELDPDNATLSLQSRFSLLGTYPVEQKPSYVS